MKLDITRVKVWSANISDKPGALAKKLSAIAEAGANLGFVLARRAPDKPGRGVVFLAPLAGASLIRAAKKAGFRQTKKLFTLRVEGADKAGLGAAFTQAIAGAGISLRGLAAATTGRKCVMHIAFDKADDATLAGRILRKL